MADALSSIDADPSLLGELSEDQQVQLTEVLDTYLRQLEQGEAPSRQQLLDDHPHLVPALELYLDKLDDLHLLAGGPNTSGHDLAGKVLGEYQLIEELGRGGMGIVYSAHQQTLNRPVAVKLLPMAAMLEPKYLERFRNEARAAANLEHPNIVPVYTVGEEGGIHYYSMRWIDGSSLDQRILVHRQNATSPRTAAALLQFANVADALHATHEFGIVHRDIKPSNLLLDHAGKLWVADFGLARFQDERALTGTGEMIGTMRYMSPEQALGRSEFVDHRTDIYSLGATLYELFTGQPAVPGEEGPSLLRTIAAQAPVRLRKLRPDLPRDLQTVLDKAMARHRDDRYETAAELAQDLRRVARGEPVTAKLVSPVVLAARWTVTHTRLVSVAIAVLAALGLALSTGTYIVNTMIARERDQKDQLFRESLALVREHDAIIDRLALVPGVEEVRRDLIPLSLSYYQNFARQAQDDPQLTAELAQALSRMGKLNEELGQPITAVDFFQRAETLFAKLVRQPSRGHLFDQHRRENLNHLAMALDRAGLGARGLEMLSANMDEMRTAYQQDQLASEMIVEYGLTENNLGLLLRKQHQLDAAQQAFENAIEALAAVQDDSPQDQASARALGAAYHNLGALYANQASVEDRQRAQELLKRALNLQLELARRAHNRLRASIDLVATYLTIGNLHLNEQHPYQAAEAFGNAAKINDQLVAIAPQVDAYRRDLAICLSNLGMAHYQCGETQLAKDSLKGSVHQYRQLLDAHPNHAGLQASLGIALNNQGMVLQHVGEQSAAEEAYQRATELLEQTQREHASQANSDALCKVYVNHVRMLQDAGRNDEANQVLQRQLALVSRDEDKR